MRWFNVFLITFLCFSGSRVMAAAADSRESIFGRDVESGSPIEVVVTGGRGADASKVDVSKATAASQTVQSHREPVAFDETVFNTPRPAQVRSHHSVHSDLPPEMIGSDTVRVDLGSLTGSEPTRFDVGEYFDREAYLTEKVRDLLKLEMAYDFRTQAYSRVGSLCMWSAGLSVGSATILSVLSSANIIDPQLGNVLTACLSAGSGVCMWAGGQLKKSSKKYEEASRKIKHNLGLPNTLMRPSVDIRIDPLRLGPAEESSAIGRSTFRRAAR